MSVSQTALIVGDTYPFAQNIAARLRDAGMQVITAAPASGNVDALVIVLPPPALGTTFLAIDDEKLEASLEQFLDLFGLLHELLPRLRDGGSAVVVSARGHLGSWGGVHEAAFSGAVAGLFRSVTMENMARGVRANVIAVELPGYREPSDPEQVANLAAFLLSPAAASLNGELLLANSGRSLNLREGRDRALKLPSGEPFRQSTAALDIK